MIVLNIIVALAYFICGVWAFVSVATKPMPWLLRSVKCVRGVSFLIAAVLYPIDLGWPKWLAIAIALLVVIVEVILEERNKNRSSRRASGTNH